MLRLTEASFSCEIRLVNPLELLGQTITPDGTDMKLTRRASEYIILANGKSLMSNRMHDSEEAMATLACRRVRTMGRPCVRLYKSVCSTARAQLRRFGDAVGLIKAYAVHKVYAIPDLMA